MDNTNVIELNGKRYDAVTGKYLGKSRAKPVPAAPAPKGKAIDGVVRPTARPHASSKRPEPVKSKPKSRPARHHAPKHAAAHKPQHTKTLMRHAVAKPKPIAKPLKSKELDKAPNHTLAIKESVSKINPYRQQRANLAARHGNVQRFQSQPNRANIEPVTAARSTRQHNISRQELQAVNTPPKRDYNAMFEAAIAHATSHEHPAPRVKKRRHGSRLIHASVAIVLVVIVGGIVAWTQRGQIQLQVASWQVGFDARMPSYSLTDYQRSEIRQEHGSIVMVYQSGDRHYQITQQQSSWNSQTLLDQSVAGASTEEPQIVESKGRIIYIYGNNVSWVDGGVRYDITGNAPLTTKDVISIVDSM